MLLQVTERFSRRQAFLGALAFGGASAVSAKFVGGEAKVFLQSSFGSRSLPEPSVDMFFAPPWRIVASNVVPDHEFGPFPSGENRFSVSAQRHFFLLPSSPTAGPTPLPIGLSAFGVALNGIPFDPAGPYWRGNRHSGWQFEAMSPAVRGHLGLDCSHAHVHADGIYHYHGPPLKFLGSLNIIGGPPNRMVFVGFAADGFPIYWRWGHLVPDDPESPLVELHSGYGLRTGSRGGGPGGRYDGTFVEDHVYEGGRGRLDPLNGRIGVTPEWPSGIFHYILTSTFPWVPRFFRGQPHPSFALHSEGFGVGLASL
jgi:hypothetical protein